ALEAQPQGAGKGAHGQRLGQAGDAFEQDVAAGEQADEEAFDEEPLADEDAGDLGEEGVEALAGGFNSGGVRGGVGGTRVAVRSCVSQAPLTIGAAPRASNPWRRMPTDKTTRGTRLVSPSWTGYPQPSRPDGDRRCTRPWIRPTS